MNGLYRFEVFTVKTLVNLLFYTFFLPHRVDISHYDNLVAMDFPAGAAAEALRQTDNDLNASVEVCVVMLLFHYLIFHLYAELFYF